MLPIRVIVRAHSYRAATEDRAAVLDHTEGRVIVVTDGVGGRSNGGRAAAIAVASIGRRLPSMSGLHRNVVWHELLEAVDLDVRDDGGGGETTAVVVAVTALGSAGAAVGDSEAWLVAPDRVVVLAGRARRKPYLGMGGAVPESFAVRRWTGTLIVATDGLFKYAEADRIAAAARIDDQAAAADALARLPASPSSGAYPDDFALVVCRPTDGDGP